MITYFYLLSALIVLFLVMMVRFPEKRRELIIVHLLFLGLFMILSPFVLISYLLTALVVYDIYTLALDPGKGLFLRKRRDS